MEKDAKYIISLTIEKTKEKRKEKLLNVLDLKNPRWTEKMQNYRTYFHYFY